MMTPQLPDVFARKPRAPQPEYVNRVHRIGHPCALYGWFCRVRWDMKRPAGDVLLRIFHEGNRWHKRVSAAFAEAGVEYIRQEEPMHWPDLELSGHMDGLVLACRAVPELKPGEKAVVDAKGMSDFAFAAINSLEDLSKSKQWYHRAYITQPSIYAVHPQVNADWCCLYCIKRSSAETKQLWWQPQDAVVQIVEAKRACQGINKAIHENALGDDGRPLPPIHLSCQGTWCEDCDFQSACPEYVLQSVGIVIVDDEIKELVARRFALQEAVREHRSISDRLRDFWKRAGPGEYLCGDHTAIVKEVPEKQMPAYTKASYMKTTYRAKNG